MGQVQGMNQWLPDIRINMAGQRAEPGFHRVDAFSDCGEAESVDDPLDRTDPPIGARATAIRHGDRRGEIADSELNATERLEREIGIVKLVVGSWSGSVDGGIVDAPHQ